MGARRLLPPPLNCFWLFLPVLAFDALYAAALPAALQPDIFWRDIPPVLSATETVGRVATMVLAAYMPLAFHGARRKLGGLVYLAGMAAYLGSWLALMRLPESAWSLSATGFAAPAYTPLVWLAGISLIGSGRSRRLDGAFAVAALAFCAAHVAHALLVWSRVS